MRDRINNEEEFIKVFASVTDEDDMKRLFKEIFTEKEYHDLLLRWKLLKLLNKKIPQRKIAKELSISLCKITRGSKILKKKDSFIKTIIDINGN